ncbi:MAG TPA: HXXEE domain-containing protein [Solirubrobacterales bacterium]|nr:HXXEE domain-containing protein [Solirubrobacterales bacterium]
MSHEWVLWVLVTASAMHVVEEHALGWQGWATGYIGPKINAIPTWTDFWATNALLIVFGISAAMVGWWAPGFSLAFPAVCLINAVFFHFLPTLQAGRLNPGCITAAVLYVPIGLWAYVAAADDGVLGAGSLVLSLAIGALMMAAAVVMLAIHPRLGYPDADQLPAAAISSSSRRCSSSR